MTALDRSRFHGVEHGRAAGDDLAGGEHCIWKLAVSRFGEAPGELPHSFHSTSNGRGTNSGMRQLTPGWSARLPVMR